MLVQSSTFDEKHNLVDRWEEDVYVIEGQPSADIPVFVVKKEKGTGKTRRLQFKSCNEVCRKKSYPGCC